MMSVWLKNSKNMSKYHWKHGVVNQVKYRKRASKRKWTDREYHVQDNSDVAHKYVKMYCDTNQLPELPFCGSLPKPHGSRGLSKHDHLRFHPKLGHGICAILRIPCACVVCTPIIYQQWISGIPLKIQARYQLVINCTYWPVMGSYKNWNITPLTLK